MFRLFIASCLFASLLALPIIEDKKTFPKWPKAFTVIMGVTEPLNQGNKGEQEFKIWYDGEEGNFKTEMEEDGVTLYALKNYKGTGVHVRVDKYGDCEALYGDAGSSDAFKDPFPLPKDPQYLAELEEDGEKIELWRFKEGEGRQAHIVNAFVKRQGDVGMPVRFEIFEDVPTVGSTCEDMILPTVVEVKSFSATKPDASVFQFDASKCKERPKLNFIGGIY